MYLDRAAVVLKAWEFQFCNKNLAEFSEPCVATLEGLGSFANGIVSKQRDFFHTD